MSFADKLANGIAIAMLQQFNPCSETSTEICKKYYREILTFIPSGVSVLTVIMTLTIWRTDIGGNRLETITIDGDSSKETRALLNDDDNENEQRPLLV